MNREQQIEATFAARETSADVKARQIDAMWRLRERFHLRREVGRLHTLGRVTNRTRPQLLVRDASGRWCPELKVVG